MALRVQHPETDRLAGEHQTISGDATTQAANNSLSGRLPDLTPQEEQDKAERIAAIEAIVADLAKLPVLDNRSPDEIIGYNEYGLFD